VDAWVALLEQTKLHELSAEEVDQVADTLNEKTVQRRLYTPWKRRKIEEAGAPSPSESAASFQDVTFVAPMDDLGDVDAPNLVLSNLALEWPGLVRNLTTLHEMVATAKRGNKEVASALHEEVQTISGQLLLILSKLGDRPENFNGASAFEVVDELKTEVRGMAKGMDTMEELVQRLNDRGSKLTVGLEDLAALVHILKRNGRVTTTDLTESRDSVLNQVREAIQPFIKLVGRLFSSKEDPGGLLIKTVVDLERTVVELRATKADSPSAVKTTSWQHPPGPTRAQSLSWSLSTEPGTTSHAGSSMSQAGGQGDTQETQNRVRSLERRVADLEGQLGGASIVVAGAEFKSITNAGAWLKANASVNGDYAYFVDAHGLMALAYGRGSTAVEVLKMDEYKKKLKYTSIDAALIAAGFQIAIPEFFGVKTSDQSAKALPGLSKAKDWDAKDGDRGLRYYIGRKCMAVYMDRSATTMYSLSPVANLIASTMLTEAQEFVTTLITWINTFLTDRGNKGDDEQETIQHMAHAIRTICEMLHAARAPGRGPFRPGEKGVKIFWGTLQALGVMRELRMAKFSAHPALSHILNLHLQDNALTKSEMTSMERRLKSVIEEVKALKSSVDRKVGFAGKKKAKGTPADDGGPEI
jgi:hypothetical protein